MAANYYSSGEIAKLAGLTIRTLQHYDNIGLLPARRTENGQRQYCQDDLARLEQIIFYRSLGFPLEQIQENLQPHRLPQEAAALLAQQKTLLYHQAERLQNSIAALEAGEEILAAGKTPPWSLLAVFMQTLKDVDLAAWSHYDFSPQQREIFAHYFSSLEDVLAFYRTWKRLSIKAAAFCAAAIPPKSSAAQKLAAAWQAMTVQVTGGNPEHLAAYLAVDQDRQSWSQAERVLIEQAEPYLELILKHHSR